MKTKLLLLLAIIPILLAGCASIVDGGPKTVQVSSNPPGAKLTVFNKKGKEISVQTTPATISLKRAQGYFSGEDYRLVFEHAGHYPFERHIKSTVNGWYFGNFVFGGLLGLLIVDPATGAMYTLSPKELDCNLISSAVSLTPEELKLAELKANPVPEKKPAVSPKSKTQ